MLELEIMPAGQTQHPSGYDAACLLQSPQTTGNRRCRTLGSAGDFCDVQFRSTRGEQYTQRLQGGVQQQLVWQYLRHRERDTRLTLPPGSKLVVGRFGTFVDPTCLPQ